MSSLCHLVLLMLNAVSLAIVMVASMAVYFRRPRPLCLRQHVVQIALVMIASGSFGALLAPIYWADSPQWWAVTFRVGVAIIAFRSMVYALRASPADSANLNGKDAQP